MHGVVCGEQGRRLWPPAILSLDQMTFPVLPISVWRCICLSSEALPQLSFHFSDELICGVFFLGFVCLFGFAFVADWIMLIRRAGFRASCSSAMFALGPS